MIRSLLGGALSLALLTPAFSDSFTDAGGTVIQPTVDVSRSAHAAVQCALAVSTTASSLAQLWSAASCPSMPVSPQFAFVMPTGGSIFYRTDGTTVTASNGWPIFQNQAWPVEGRLSVNGLQLIAGSNVATLVEVRY